MFNNQMPPGIYNIVYNNEQKSYSIVQGPERFKLPPVLYGDIERTAIRVWNTFSLSKLSTGILLTGESGSGKSLLAELICNTAIDKNIPVIYITAISIKPELLQMLQRLSNIVLYIDEFGKCSNHDTQNTMLSFFSDTNTRKLFILTENNEWMVNSFILNRPGRIRYHIDYKKVPKKIILDFLDKNSKDDKFKEEVYKLYTESRVFSFDHLQTLVSEHDRYPDDSLEDLLDILNLGVLAKPFVVYVKSVLNKVKNTEIDRKNLQSNPSMSFDEWTRYKYNEFIVRIPISEDPNEPYQRQKVCSIRYQDCKVKDDDDFIWEDDEYMVTLSKTRNPDALK